MFFNKKKEPTIPENLKDLVFWNAGDRLEITQECNDGDCHCNGLHIVTTCSFVMAISPTKILTLPSTCVPRNEQKLMEYTKKHSSLCTVYDVEEYNHFQIINTTLNVRKKESEILKIINEDSFQKALNEIRDTVYKEYNI